MGLAKTSALANEATPNGSVWSRLVSQKLTAKILSTKNLAIRKKSASHIQSAENPPEKYSDI